MNSSKGLLLYFVFGWLMMGCGFEEKTTDILGSIEVGEVGQWTEGNRIPGPKPIPNSCDAEFRWHGEVQVETEDAEDAESSAPGVDATVGVDARGGVGIEIPLHMPASSRQMMPPWRVSCQGQGQEMGLFGAGCGLKGLEQIVRCGQRREIDGVRRSVQWDSRDRLCLNGAMLWTDEDGYWEAEVYHPTDRPEDLVIPERNGVGKIVGFREERRDGLIRYYGEIEGEGTFVEGRINERREQPAYMYRLRKVIDRDGYGMAYGYTLKEVLPPRIVQREMEPVWWSQPKWVKWGFREVNDQTVQDAEWEAEIEYSASEPEAHIGYVGGFRLGDGGLVKSIVIRSAGEERQEVWRYRFTYEEQSRTQRLSKVRKCIGSAWSGVGEEVCGRPRVLTYRAEEPGRYEEAEIGITAGDVRYYPSEEEPWVFRLQVGSGGAFFVMAAPDAQARGGAAGDPFDARAEGQRRFFEGEGRPVENHAALDIEVRIRAEGQCKSGDWSPLVQDIPWGGERIVYAKPGTDNNAARWHVLECDEDGVCRDRETGVGASERYTGVSRNGVCMFAGNGRGKIRYADLNLDGVVELYIESSDASAKDRQWVWLKPDERMGLVPVRTDIPVFGGSWVDVNGDGTPEMVKKEEGEQGSLLWVTNNLRAPEIQGESYLGETQRYTLDEAGSYQRYSKGTLQYGDVNGDGRIDQYESRCGEDRRAIVISGKGAGLLETQQTDFKLCMQQFTGAVSEEISEVAEEQDGQMVYMPHVVHLNDDRYPDMVRLVGLGAKSLEGRVQLGTGRVSEWFLLTGPDVEEQEAAGMVQPGRVQFELYGEQALMRIQSFREGFVGSYGRERGLWLPGKNAAGQGEWMVLVAEREQVHVLKTGVPYIRKDDGNLPDDVTLGVAHNLLEEGAQVKLWKASRQARMRKMALVDMDGDGQKDVHTVLRNGGVHRVYYFEGKQSAFAESYVDYRSPERLEANDGDDAQGLFLQGEKQDWLEVQYDYAVESNVRPDGLRGGERRGLGERIVQRRQHLGAEGEILYNPWSASALSREARVIPLSGEGLELVSKVVRHTGAVDERGEPIVQEMHYQWGGMGRHQSTGRIVLPKWQRSAESLSGKVLYVERGKQFKRLEGDDVFEGALGRLMYGAVATYRRESQRVAGEEKIIQETFHEGWKYLPRWNGRAGQVLFTEEEVLVRHVDGPRKGQVYKKEKMSHVYGRQGEILSKENRTYVVEEAGEEQLVHRSYELKMYAQQGLAGWLGLPVRVVQSEWEPEGAHQVGGDAILRTTLYQYDENTGRLLEQAEEPQDAALRRSTRYVYSDEGHLIETWQEHADGQHERLLSRERWDSRGKHVVCEENGLGHVTKYAHHPVLGVINKAQGPNGLVHATGHDMWGRTHWERSVEGSIEENQYRIERDRDGGVKYPLVVESRRVGQGRRVQKYNGAGEVVHERSRQHRAQWVWSDKSFDSRGRLSAEYGPYRMERCAGVEGGLNEVLLEDGAPGWCGMDMGQVPVRRYTYDGYGRKIKVEHPHSAESQIIYNGLETTSINALGGEKKETRDVMGRVVWVEDPEVRLHAEWNDENGALELINAAGEEALGGCRVNYRYDAGSRMVEVRVCDQAHTTKIVYDKYGQKLRLESPDSGVLQYGYDGYGQLSWTEDGLGQRVGYYYDKLGRKVLEVRPEGMNRWWYDSAAGAGIGKLAKSESHDGVVKQYQYDEAGRVMTKQTLLSKEAEEAWQVEYRYDPSNRLVEETRSWVEEADAANNIGEAQHAGWLRVQYRYENSEDARAENLWGSQLETVHVQRQEGQGSELVWRLVGINAFGQVEEDRYGNGVEGYYNHDARAGVLKSIWAARPGAEVASQDKEYSYDALLQVTEEQDGLFQRERKYRYDELNRLVEVQEWQGESTGYEELYAFDKWGNLLRKQESDLERGAGGTLQAVRRLQMKMHYGEGAEAGWLHNQPHAVRQIDVQEQVRADNGGIEIQGEAVQVLDYDTLGNLRDYKGNEFIYTSFQKPRAITTEPNPRQHLSHQLRYDANGTRVEKRIVQEGAQEIGEDFASLEILQQLGNYERTKHQDGAVLHTHFITAGSKGMVAILKEEEAAAAERGDPEEVNNRRGEIKLLFVHLERQGSVDALTNDAGNVIELPRYRTGGEPEEGTLSEVQHGYTGHRHDQGLGLIDMNARYLIPEVHRFTSADTVIPNMGNSQDYNRYSYVRNNPYRYTDPTGHSPVGGEESWEIGGFSLGISYEQMGFDVSFGFNVSYKGLPAWVDATLLEVQLGGNPNAFFEGFNANALWSEVEDQTRLVIGTIGAGYEDAAAFVEELKSRDFPAAMQFAWDRATGGSSQNMTNGGVIEDPLIRHAVVLFADPPRYKWRRLSHVWQHFAPGKVRQAFTAGIAVSTTNHPNPRGNPKQNLVRVGSSVGENLYRSRVRISMLVFLPSVETSMGGEPFFDYLRTMTVIQREHGAGVLYYSTLSVRKIAIDLGMDREKVMALPPAALEQIVAVQLMGIYQPGIPLGVVSRERRGAGFDEVMIPGPENKDPQINTLIWIGLVPPGERR